METSVSGSLLPLCGGEDVLQDVEGRSLQLVGAAVQLDLEGLEVWPVSWLGAPTF